MATEYVSNDYRNSLLENCCSAAIFFSINTFIRTF